MFGSTKHKLNLPHGAHCDLHRTKKVNCSIPNSRATIEACIEESLNSIEHGVAHTTSVLKTDCLASQWHIARLPLPKARDVGRCNPIWGLCEMPKSVLANMTLLLQLTKGSKKEFCSTNNAEYKF